MVYKKKIESLLDSTRNKLRIVENIANGSMNMPSQDVINLINDLKRMNEQLIDLVSIEKENEMA
jgi:hypothetical protein